MADELTTDVLVVGAGPCGMTLANLLGTYGVNAIVIDREPDVIDYPRAVGIDDESLRTCQTIGLVDAVLADTLQDMPIRYYTSWGRCFAHVQPTARPFGWPRRNLFLQPLLERTLREGFGRFPSIDLRLGHELHLLRQDALGTHAVVGRDNGNRLEVRARFTVGADGGRSTVREQIRVTLEGTTEPVKWLVVDVENDVLDAPYSAVYCNSGSPTLMVPLPHGHRRFEFRLDPGEDERSVVTPDHVRRLLAPRYAGLPLPDVLRARVYLHHSRTASTFRRGRVFLAGDAAHLQPPFFGQGMNSGFRDATNLAWKLAAVLTGCAGEGALDSYDAERRPHASEMVRFATRMGAMYRPRNVWTERARDLAFRGIQCVPGGRDYVLQMKYKPMPRYTRGIVTGVDRRNRADPVGRMFPQPRVALDGQPMLLDDALGPWFAVLCYGWPGELDRDALGRWLGLGASAFFLRCDGHRPERAGDDVVVIDDLDGALGRWREAHPEVEVVILRPDRYVAAACSALQFADATTALARGLA
jgi:3-(3-hydroxy-phenyl)propionate hydroxylase